VHTKTVTSRRGTSYTYHVLQATMDEGESATIGKICTILHLTESDLVRRALLGYTKLLVEGGILSEELVKGKFMCPDVEIMSLFVGRRGQM